MQQFTKMGVCLRRCADAFSGNYEGTTSGTQETRRECTIQKTATGTGFKVQNLSWWQRRQGIILSLLFPVVGAVLHRDFSCCRLYRAKLFHRVLLRFLAPQPQLREKGAGDETDAGLTLWSMAAGKSSPSPSFDVNTEYICFSALASERSSFKFWTV